MRWEEKDNTSASEVIVAALTSALFNFKYPKVEIFSNNRALVTKLSSFHRLLSAQNIYERTNNGCFDVVEGWRGVDLTIDSFNPSIPQQLERIYSSKQFHYPYFYPFWNEMDEIGRRGFKEAKEKYHEVQDQIIQKIGKFNASCNQKYLARKKMNNTPNIIPIRAVSSQ